MTKKPRSGKGSPKGGRPEYKPTIEARQTVEEMKYCGESENVIARALGIDPDTLRKHFADELENGHSNRRREVIGLMFKSARDGNSSNQKRLEEIGRVAGAVERVEEREKSVPSVGKKEARKAAADAVTGKFAPPEGPKLIVSNR
jgi:phage repressor protein C with HTH and peptisase S24 domain